MVSVQEVITLIATGVFTGEDNVDEGDTFKDLYKEPLGRKSQTDFQEEQTFKGTKSKSSFTSSIVYPFSFSEVAFLMLKLYQCADRRYKLRERSGVGYVKEDDAGYEDGGKQLDVDEIKADLKTKKKLLLKLNIEKLSKMQDLQLNFVSALSTKNKRRWICITEKVIEEINKQTDKKQDEELLLMRMTVWNDMSEFINIELCELMNEDKDKMKKNPINSKV